MVITDFIGQPIEVGDFVAYPGRGNASAEYGQILMKVLEVRKDSIQVMRLHVTYPDNKNADITFKKSTIKSFTKLVKVDLSSKVRDVFHDFKFHEKLIGKWIHGATLIDWKKV